MTERIIAAAIQIDGVTISLIVLKGGMNRLISLTPAKAS